jgi:hypothetical protein
MNVNTQWFAASASSRTSLRGPNVARIGVGHALIDNCSSQQVCASIIAHARNAGKPAFVITPNAQHIVLLEKERRLQEFTITPIWSSPTASHCSSRRACMGVRCSSALPASISSRSCAARRRDRSACLPTGRPAGLGRAGRDRVAGRLPGFAVHHLLPSAWLRASALGLKQTAQAITACAARHPVCRLRRAQAGVLDL